MTLRLALIRKVKATDDRSFFLIVCFRLSKVSCTVLEVSSFSARHGCYMIIRSVRLKTVQVNLITMIRWYMTQCVRAIPFSRHFRALIFTRSKNPSRSKFEISRTRARAHEQRVSHKPGSGRLTNRMRHFLGKNVELKGWGIAAVGYIALPHGSAKITTRRRDPTREVSDCRRCIEWGSAGDALSRMSYYSLMVANARNSTRAR